MSRTCPTCGASYSDAAFFCGVDGVITVQDQDPNDFDPRLGKQLGAYTLVARVADGAMGRVYEGRHPQTKARVAIKVLHEQIARDRIAVERFKREYQSALELNNPYIVHVHEFGESPDRSYFMTMEYLEGEELSKALADRKPLPFPRIVRSICQIALALEHAHSYGFIHRDLKPDNIFLCATGDGVQVRLLDFGSVKLQVETGKKLTALGTTLGSPYYMSPEQATGASDVDQRSDVFALGAILYEMLTGKTAFEAPTVAMILLKILNQTPAPPSTFNMASTDALDKVVDRALRKDKDTRYQTTRELADGLVAALGLTGTCEAWASKSEPDIALALSVARPRADGSAAPQPESSRPPASSHHPPRTSPPRSQSTRPEPSSPPRSTADYASARPEQATYPRDAGHREAPLAGSSGSHEVPLTVPMHSLKPKWLVAAAIALVVVVALVLLSR